MTVIPVFEKLIAPDSDVYFRRDQFRYLAGNVSVDEKVILLVSKEDQAMADRAENSFYPIGLAGTVSEISNDGYAVVHANGRVNIESVVVNRDHSISLMTSRRPDIHDLSVDEAQEKLYAAKEAVKEFSSGFQWGEAVKAYVDHMDSLGTLAGMLSIWMSAKNEEYYEVLAEDSNLKRAELMEKLIYEFLEVAKVTNDANSAHQKEYQDFYKESAIKKQLEYLQKELDEMHPEQVTDVRKFEMKIAESGMNETARTEANKVLNRLKQEGNKSPEYGMLYDYLDFVTSLNWKKSEPEIIDLDEAREVLEADHYGLKKVKRRVVEQIAVMNLKREQSGSILLFVGAPGTGKTSIGRSIAKALKREYVRISLGGVRDEADIRGHRRTYIGAMPGRIMDGIQKSGVSNPVVVLDEVDKLASSYNGDPASALLEVLDPEQNDSFTDHYMNVPYDLSDVLFICTANTADTIPEPLLNRMEVIQFEGYTPIEKRAIAREHLLPSAMKAMGIGPGQLEVSDEVIDTLISDYTREAGVRGLRKRIDTLCRGAAVELASDSEKVFTVTPDQLRDDLDMRPVRHARVPEKQKPGVVTGLAWTSVGGEILYIESLFTKGAGKIQTTGKLGDVMKESALIAVSLVKSMFPEKAKLFKENDLHIHVPEGAVPKDGPSAGVTMTTAIASLVTGKAFPADWAMTGEVSLRGSVTAIGGLPEKLLAAHRAGVSRVFIPKENVDDLRDVPEEVKQAIEITPVSDVTEVLQIADILPKERKSKAKELPQKEEPVSI
ncbi:MAG: endopeptidase La [Oscillospiraceae bacterium]|nr:endopeptidase La [Oscillospiraceae bacterium]